VLAVLLLLLSSNIPRSVGSKPPIVMPPPTEGVINGKEALLIWPADQSGTLLDPDGCKVLMIPADEPATLTYPCGRWFLPPRPERYDYWLEQGNQISRSQNVLFYSGGRSTIGFRIADRIGPAGFVKVATAVGRDETFRIVSLASPAGFELNLTSDEILSNVRIPAGPTLGGVFDSEGNAVALTKTVDVTEAGLVTLNPAAPAASTSDLLVVLDKWGRNRPTNVRIELQLAKGNRAPDAFGETDGRVIAVWYGLPPGNARALITADGVESAILPVVLSAIRVATMRSQFPIRRK
jgi:hypothetical protein